MKLAKIVSIVIAITLILVHAMIGWQQKRARENDDHTISCSENLDCGEFGKCDPDKWVCREKTHVTQVCVDGRSKFIENWALLMDPTKSRVTPMCFSPPRSISVECLPKEAFEGIPPLSPATVRSSDKKSSTFIVPDFPTKPVDVRVWSEPEFIYIVNKCGEPIAP